MTDLAAMSDLASPQPDRPMSSPAQGPSRMAQLRRIEALGRGSIEITPHAIALPLLAMVIGCGFVYGILTFVRVPVLGMMAVVMIGAAVIGMSLRAMGPRKPCFTLSEEGVRVNKVLLPWSSIKDYSVAEDKRLGLTTRTTVFLRHVDGFVVPKLGQSFLFGRRIKRRRGAFYETQLMLHVGAKGMDCEKLAQRIGEFRAAAYARDRILSESGANGPPSGPPCGATPSTGACQETKNHENQNLEPQNQQS